MRSMHIELYELVAETQKPVFFDAKTSDARRAGFIYVLAGSGLILLITFLEAISPDYSLRGNTISDLLALGTTTATIGEPTAFLLAVAWVFGAYYMFRVSRRKGFGVLNLLPGVGLLLVVLSPENLNVAVHSVGAALGSIAGAIVMIWSYRVIRSPIRYFSLALGVLSLVATVILFGAYYSPLVQNTLGPGGWERIIVYPLFLWLIMFGSEILSSRGTVIPVMRRELNPNRRPGETPRLRAIWTRPVSRTRPRGRPTAFRYRMYTNFKSRSESVAAR